MVRTKLVSRRARRQWVIPTSKKIYEKFKRKTLLPEQKIIEINKNGQVLRTITSRRKTKKITNR